LPPGLSLFATTDKRDERRGTLRRFAISDWLFVLDKLAMNSFLTE
jgi:hypothetical protein